MKYEVVADAYRDLEQASGRLALIDRLAALLELDQVVVVAVGHHGALAERELLRRIGRGLHLHYPLLPSEEARAAQLRKVELVAPRSPIGKNTVESLQSGILYGFAGQVDGMVRRLSRALAPDAPDSVHVIATGGLANLIADESKYITQVDHLLTLNGLRLIYLRNLKPAKRARRGRSLPGPAS